MTLEAQLEAFLSVLEPELVAFRRDLHANPEVGWAEHRTTAALRARLAAAGLSPKTLPSSTGLVCDVGERPTVALRADLDALPVEGGVAHACGHDVHTTVVLGAGLFLADLLAAGRLERGVRLLFQPAEEVMPGGALAAIDAGALAGLEEIYALHCDPQVPVGRVALRVGAITSASDAVEVRLSGPGGHTARPHLTADLVSALGDVVTRTPALLTRRVDPRAGASLVWGQVAAGSAHNAIPSSGFARGTLRILDQRAWQTVPAVLDDIVRSVAAAYGVSVEVEHRRGVPPVVNDAAAVGRLREAALGLLGPDSVLPTEQSLGGEDFGWYLQHVPGALARLGVAGPDVTPVDLHQPGFDVDERCIGVGVRVLVGAALGGRGST